MGSSSSLLKASSSGDVSRVKRQLKRQNSSRIRRAADAAGCSALFLACRGGHAPIVPLLLDAHADPNSTNKLGVSALQAACQGGHATVTTHLLKAGANHHILDEEGRTPLMIASCAGHADVVQELLKAGAEIDVEVRGKVGHTSLYMSSTLGHSLVVQCLVDWGANVTVKDQNGFCPMHIGKNSLSYHLVVV